MKSHLVVVFYKTQSEHEPVREWLSSLTKSEKKRIGEDILTIQFGWTLGMPLVKKLENGLWEIRTKLQNKVSRVVFTLVGQNVVLLHAFIKKTLKIPAQDLELARSRMKKFKGG